MNLRITFASLRYPNYRLWFFGQLISLFGTWMQMTAQSYFIYELTKSPAFLGYVSFAFGVPSWLFMLYGGVIADRISRRLLLIITQTSMMVLASILATLTFSGWIRPWHIVLLAFGSGIANAFDAPARQAIVLELVEREDLMNAIALNSMLFNSSSVIGPAIAGVVYVSMGPAWCFTFNAVSFLAVIAALYCMSLRERAVPLRETSTLLSLKEGLQYVFFNRPVLALITIVAVTTLFGFSFVTLMPAWVIVILKGNAATNGLLQSARGVGALIGALVIASLGRFTYKGRLLTYGTFVFPVTLFVFALVRWLPFSLLIMVVLGIALVFILNLGNTLLQSLAPEHLRGRVMSIYSLTQFGFMPIGGLLAGIIAEYAGEPATIIASALVCLLCAVFVRVVANVNLLDQIEHRMYTASHAESERTQP